MCFPKKKKKKHEKKSSTKAAQKQQQQQQKRATTKTMNFQTSTQKKSWMFSSPEHVARRRREQRKKTLIALLRGRNEEKEEKEGEEEKLLEKEFSFPSAKDEEIYRKRLEAKIDSLCSAFNLPVKVTVSATTLFKRYCLANPIMLTNLKIVMVASVYVACKVEESYVSAEQLCKVVKDIDYNKVLNAELAVLQGVDFQLISFGAFRPLRGFRADAIHSVSSSNNNEGGGGDASSNSKELVVEKIRECYNKSQEDLKKQLLTDAMFLFPPGQLALSAFLKAAREMGCNELEEYIVTKCLRNEPDLLKNLSIIENMAKEQGEEPKDTEAKKADQAMKAFQKKNAKTLSAALKKQASKENLGGEDEEEDEETRKQKKQKLVDEERAKEDAAFD